MNDRIRKMLEEIHHRGGVVHLDDDLPDAIAERFLAELLACPDCMEQLRRDRKQREH
jgi:hypothetical protein